MAEPPLWSVARAEVVLTPGPTSVTCQARFQVRLVAGGRLAIPLLAGTFTVESVTASGRAHVTMEATGAGGKAGGQAESQRLVCVLDRPGEETVTVAFRVPAQHTEQGLRFTVPLADACSPELHLQLADPNSRVETDPQAVLSQPAGQLTAWLIRPVHPGPVTVTVTPLGLPGDELTYCESHSVSAWEGKPGYRDAVDLVFSGSRPAQPLEVEVPEGGTVREVESTDPLTWSLSPDGRQLLLSFGGEGPLRQTVSVVLDLFFNPDNPSISLASMGVHARRLGGSLSLDLAGEEVEARGLTRTAGPSVPRYEFGADGFSARFRLVSPKVFLRAEMSLDAHLSRGSFRCLETVNFTATGGPVREFRLRLPEGAEVHPQGIPANDLWWVAASVLVVRPGKSLTYQSHFGDHTKFAAANTYSLSLQYEVPVSDLSRIGLPVLEPVADELGGQVRLFLEPGLTAQALESRGLSQPPAGRAGEGTAEGSRDPSLPASGWRAPAGREGPSGPSAVAGTRIPAPKSLDVPRPGLPDETGRATPQEPEAALSVPKSLDGARDLSRAGAGDREPVERPAQAAADAHPALVYRMTGTGVRLLLEVRTPTPAVEVRTLALFTFEGERILMHASAVGSIARVPLSQLHLELPAGFVVTEVSGSPRPPADEHPAWEAVGDGSVLRLDLGERYKGDIRSEVQAERARGAGETAVALRPVTVKEATQSTAYLAVVTERELAATAEGATALVAVPPAVVPSELGAVPTQALCYRSVAGARVPSREGWAPDAGGELRLRVTPVEAVARARSTTVLHFTQGLLSVTCRVALTVSKGGLEGVEVVLPPGSADVAISGPSVKGCEQAGADTWRVQFAGTVYDQAEFTVEAKSLISQGQQEVTYPGIALVGIAQTGTFVVATDPDFQVEERGTEGLSPTMGKGAPGYGELVDGRALYGYSFERVPFKLSLLTTRLARAETVQARASAAQLTTVIADRETAVSRMLYFVENPGRKQFVVVKLRPECSVWSTTANGIPVKPARSTDGSLLIPIAEESQQTGAVQVELVFAEPLPKLGATAPRIALRSPGLDIPVEDLRWDVFAPKGYFLFSSRGEVVPYETPEVPGLRDLLSGVLSWLPGLGGVLEAVGSFVAEFWWLFALVAIVAVPLIVRYIFGLRFSIVAFFLILFIVVVFSSMMMPALSRSRPAARQAAWVSNSRANLKQIGIATFMYRNANDDLMPSSSDQLVGYLEGRAVFGNPAVPGTGYVYVQGLPPVSEIQNPAQVIVAFEEESHRPEGTNALFLDGHVSTVPKTPEQIRQQVIEEFAGRPLGFEVARGEVPAAAGGEQGFLTGFGRMEAPLQREGLQQAASKAGPADEFRGAERQRLNEENLKARYEREADKGVEGKDQQKAFLMATVVTVPAAQAVTEVHAGRAKGAMPMLLSLPTGGDRYRLYQPFVEREPGGFTLTLLARGPFQWVRALLFLVLTGGFVASARRWPRGGLAAGGATTLVLLLVHLTSAGGVRHLSEAALGATVIALIATGVIYQRRQSAKDTTR